jgi:tetratricopeptide (TPR) repeat protein
MNKAFIFVFGGTAVIYYACFGSHHKFKFPTYADVKNQYEIKKIEKENIELKLKLQKAEFTLARVQEASSRKTIQRAVASAPQRFNLFPENKSMKDHVKQEIYQWSQSKLLALSEREYKLKNYEAAAQYAMTLVNIDPNDNQMDENFYYRLGVSCIESKSYLNEGIVALSDLVNKFPDSALVVQAKLWRGLAYHRLNNKTEFLAMMEEFKTKYRNTKEWTVLKNIYDRSIASGNENNQKKSKEKKNDKNQEGRHE